MDLSDILNLIPFVLGLIVVVPLTSDVIHCVLVDKLDFDVIINEPVLRVLELIIAFLIFPSAVLIYLVLLLYYLLVGLAKFVYHALSGMTRVPVAGEALVYLAWFITYIAAIVATIVAFNALKSKIPA